MGLAAALLKKGLFAAHHLNGWSCHVFGNFRGPIVMRVSTVICCLVIEILPVACFGAKLAAEPPVHVGLNKQLLADDLVRDSERNRYPKNRR